MMSSRPSPKHSYNRGNKILRQLMNSGSKSRGARRSGRELDTYQGLRRLKELYQNGEITRDEYDRLKLELLLKG